MINFNKEYYSNNYYFFLKDRGDKISLYYSVADTLTESRKNDSRMDFDKKETKKVKDIVGSVLKSGKKQTTKDIEKKLNTVKKSGEIDELVDSDGTMSSSRIPILNLALHPRKTMDQTVPMARVSNDPVVRGYRVYYGESEEKDNNIVSEEDSTCPEHVSPSGKITNMCPDDDDYEINYGKNAVNEIDYSDAFGYEETEDKDFKGTVNILKKMGVENPIERAKQFGKIPKVKKVQGKLRQRLSEKDSIEEQQKQKMIKMVEDILTKKSKSDSDVVSKDESVSKILVKNLQSIKKLADKEGISIAKLINILKKSE